MASIYLLLALIGGYQQVDSLTLNIPIGLEFAEYQEHIRANTHGIFVKARIPGKKRAESLLIYNLDGTLKTEIALEGGFFVANFETVENPNATKTGSEEPLLMIMSLRHKEIGQIEKRVFFFDLAGKSLGVGYDSIAGDGGRDVYFRQVFNTGETLIGNTWLYGDSPDNYSELELVEFLLHAVNSNPFDETDLTPGFLIQYAGEPFYQRYVDVANVTGWRKKVYPITIGDELVVFDELGRKVNFFDEDRIERGRKKLALPQNDAGSYVPAVPTDENNLHTRVTGAYLTPDRDILVTWSNPVTRTMSEAQQKKASTLKIINFAQAFDENAQPIGALHNLGKSFVCGVTSDPIMPLILMDKYDKEKNVIKITMRSVY
jgi:hypothetical protein